jgi:hypothetical protein
VFKYFQFNKLNQLKIQKMDTSLNNLKIKVWDETKESWVSSTKEIKKGIYIIFFHPESTIYEIRNLKKPENKHVIEKGEKVLKIGKFTDTLTNRFIKSYAKHWKYDYEGQGDKREYSNCFENSTTIYIIEDLSECPDSEYIELVEIALKRFLIQSYRNFLTKQEKRKSEYFRFNSHNNQVKFEEIATNIRNRIEKFIDLIPCNASNI